MSAKVEGALAGRTNGVVVFVPKYGIEGPVYLTEKAKDASMQVCPASRVKSAEYNVLGD